MLLGYARTSTLDQQAGLSDQQGKLAQAGCERVYVEQASAAEGKARPQLDALLGFLRSGDVLVVTRLDRLARSTLDLLHTVQRIEAAGAALRSLSESIDTGTPAGKLMLTVLGAIATFEREIMLDRQRAGVAKAKAEGKYVGRQPTARRKAADVLRLHAEGTGPADIARLLGIGRSSVYRVLRSGDAARLA